MKKLINWIFKNEKVEAPTWTPWEENERKYEEFHKRSRELFLKMQQEENRRNYLD